MINLSGKDTLKQAVVTTVKDYLNGTAFFSDPHSSYVNFSIQYIQREYEWEDQHVIELWNTIFLDEYPEIGNIIAQTFDEDASFTMSLLDGQQRTITLTFIAAYLEEKINDARCELMERERIDLLNEGYASNEIQDVIDTKFDVHSTLRTNLIDMINYKNTGINNKIPKIKFQNNEEFDDFFQEMLKKKRNIFLIINENINNLNKVKKIKEFLNIPHAKSSSIKAAINALILINEQLNSQLINLSEDEKIRKIIDLIERFKNTNITVELFGRKMNPSIIFENRNNKGKDLNPVSILKNTFIIAKNKMDESSGNKMTDKNEKEVNKFLMINKENTEITKKYIHSMFCIHYSNVVKEEKIVSLEKLCIFLSYSNIQNNHDNWNLSKTIEFYTLLRNNKAVYMSIVDPYSFTIEEDFKKYFCLLSGLNLTLMYVPVLLKFYPKELNENTKKEYISLLQSIIKLFFLCVYNEKNNSVVINNVLKPSYMHMHENRFNAGESIIEIIKDRLALKDVKKENLVENFNSYTHKHEIRASILFLYELLIQYEIDDFADIEKISCVDFHIPKKIEIEHIIPRNPRDKNEIEKSYISRFGNLLLMDKKTNGKASNLNFEQKKAIYRANSTRFKQIAEICALDEFESKEHIQARDEKIIFTLYKSMKLI